MILISIWQELIDFELELQIECDDMGDDTVDVIDTVKCMWRHDAGIWLVF